MTSGLSQASRRSRSGFLYYWSIVVLGGAVFVSIVDALLLQRSKSYFTGGFLVVDHLVGFFQIAAFLTISLVTDAAVIGVVSALILMVLVRFVSASAAAVGAGLVSAGSLVIANIISYELARYMGDVVDLSLSMELAGGSVAEMFAVTSSYLFTPALLIGGAGGAAGGLVWLTHRYGRGERIPNVGARALVIPLMTGLVGLGVATAASAASDAFENGLVRKPAGQVLAATVDLLTDFDRDRFGVAGRTPDPAPFDGSVFPYATEIPSNGVDEDGLAGDLPEEAASYAPLVVSNEPFAQRPDVVLIVLESFRADLLDATIDGQVVTPVLRNLAAGGVSSAHAYSHNGYTAPSRRHLFSGQLAGGDDRTLIDDFQAQGYVVGYFSGQDESFGHPSLRVGFERADVSYDARQDRSRRYTTFTTPGSLAVPFGVVQERVGKFVADAAHSAEPLFLYVNFHDTHFPYSHDQIAPLVSSERLARGDIVPEHRDRLWRMYANTAANLDRAVGEVIAAVRSARGRTPGVIVTADHGESLFDENFLGHGYALNDAQTRIPLIVADLPITIEEPFAQRDLRPALLAALRTVSASAPQIRHNPDRTVFQYLGNLARPRQIALLSADGRVVYDFRQRKVQFGSALWQRPDALSGNQRDTFERLIHDWERMMLVSRAEADGI